MFKVLNVFQVSHSLSGHANCLYKIEECQMRGVLCAWLGWVGSQGGGMPNCIKVCMSFAIYASGVHVMSSTFSVSPSWCMPVVVRWHLEFCDNIQCVNCRSWYCGPCIMLLEDNQHSVNMTVASRPHLWLWNFSMKGFGVCFILKLPILHWKLYPNVGDLMLSSIPLCLPPVSMLPVFLPAAYPGQYSYPM